MDGRQWFLGICLTCIFLPLFLGQGEGLYSAVAAEKGQEQEGQGETLEALMEEMKMQWRQLDSCVEGCSFSELVELQLSGEYEEMPGRLLKMIGSVFREQFELQKENLLKLFLLGVLSAFFVDFTNPTLKNYVGETGYFAIYIVMLMILLTAFQSLYQIAFEGVDAMFQTVRVIVPVYVFSLLLAGSLETAVGMYTLVLSSIGVVEWTVKTLIFPMIYFYFILQMLNYCMREDRLSKFASFLKQVIIWVLRFLFGLVTGMQVVQCLLLPVSDQARNSNFSKSLAAIPGLGASARALTGTMFNSAVVVKSAIGVAGMLLLVFLVMIPSARILLFILTYQLLSAVLQPVAHKRISALVGAAAQSARLLFQGLVTSTSLFLVCIAIVTASTGAAG
ncbi:MAG: stage III sporulation protein AE [Lachnospiraceae bacterium]|nr:stage III sporulation protein AE [Lachnospiraceae bacterium]